jgi:hypothetical protein
MDRSGVENHDNKLQIGDQRRKRTQWSRSRAGFRDVLMLHAQSPSPNAMGLALSAVGRMVAVRYNTGDPVQARGQVWATFRAHQAQGGDADER